MSVFDSVDTVELVARYNDLMEKYVKIAQDISPKIEKFGKIRMELQAITNEFLARGHTPEDPEKLVEIIKEEIKKRENSQNAFTDKNE